MHLDEDLNNLFARCLPAVIAETATDEVLTKNLMEVMLKFGAYLAYSYCIDILNIGMDQTELYRSITKLRDDVASDLEELTGQENI